jgi:type II secretory pathway component GspD/PulD (secretin)
MTQKMTQKMPHQMATNQVPVKSVLGRARNTILLAAIFALTACLTLSLQLVFGKSARAEVTLAELEQVRREAQAVIPRLPVDTEDRLAAALYPQLAPVANISDPFVDHAGVARANGTGNVSPFAVRTPGTTTNNETISEIPATPAVPTAVPTLVARLQSWQQSVKAAVNTGQFSPPITTAYLQTEIAPTGRIDTGGLRGAWFYIASEKRTIAATVGAKFYDAMLVSIGSEGVVFRLQNGTTKTVEWDRDEDFATRTATAPKTNEQQAQPTQSPAVKTIGEEQNPDRQQNSTSGASSPRTSPQPDRPSIQTLGAEFELLQDAVRGRYPKRSPVSETTPAPKDIPAERIALLKTGTQVVPRPYAIKPEPALSGEATPVGTNALGVRPAVERAHALDEFLQPVYAGDEFSTIPALTKASYREETSVSPQTQPLPASPENASTAKKADETQVGAPTSIQSPSPTPSPARETSVAPASGPSTAAPTSTTARTPAAAKVPPEPNGETTPPPAHGNLCDPRFRGDNITITNESNRPITLLSFVNKLNEAYGANIVLDYDVQDIPVRVNVTDAPWTSVLRTLLDLNDLDLVCLDGRIVQIAKRSKIAQMEDGRRKLAPLVREVFKLRYLQPTAGGRVNLAGVTQSAAGATIQSIEEAIRAILKAGGDTRGEARRVPGRNEIFVAATREQMAEIRDLIARVDRPGYQVLIKALVYTANENRLRDIGSQLSVILGNSGQTNLGGFTTLPRSSQNNSGSGNGTGSGAGNTNSSNNSVGLNPGGVPSLGDGFRPPTGSLGGASPLATFGVSSVFGTAQVAYQLTLAQQRGVINIQSRPFGIVSDGDTFDLVAGTQIPVVTTTIAGGAPFQSGNVQFIEASRIARITPQVAETEDGKPGFVTLQIQLENNSVDTSLGTFNGVPGVNRQSLQTVMRLHNGETAIVGGLAADTVSNAASKVPGVGDVPLFGNLFKRKTNQENRDRLYFAITVEVISQESPLINVPAPSDAMTTPPTPPSPPQAQRPSPLQHR